MPAPLVLPAPSPPAPSTTQGSTFSRLSLRTGSNPAPYIQCAEQSHISRRANEEGYKEGGRRREDSA